MSNNEHTPGLWRLTSSLMVYGGTEPIASVGSVFLSSQTNEANARLIAATPDLLDVCQRLAAWGRGEHHAGGRAQAALADILFANAAALDKATEGEET
jgi:hypothetical protein